MRNQRIQRNHETKNHPSNSIHPSHFLRRSTVGGVGVILSLGIVATDISLDNNEGAWGWWVGKQRTRAAASLETRKRVMARFEVSREFGDPIYASGSQADG